MTIAIAYNGGSYGTYLHWCLATLTSENEMTLPFNANGNSHQFDGINLPNLKSYRESKKLKTLDFVRFHPKLTQHESISRNLNEACKIFDFVIYLYPDPGSVLLSVNNFYHKIWKRWWVNRVLLDPVFYDNLKQGWNINDTDSIEDIPTWIQREILSYNLMPSWFSQVEWDNSNKWTNSKSITIMINELLYNFEDTIVKIQKFCSLEFKKTVDDLVPAHQTMLSLQSFLKQDQLCNNIVRTTVESEYFNWEDQLLPLPSQSWIQWQLRNLGYEMRCAGLDTFPTNSVHLKELLYPV